MKPSDRNLLTSIATAWSGTGTVAQFEYGYDSRGRRDWEEIIRFVSLVQADRFTITDLCEQFHITRKTAYKHLERYAEGGGCAVPVLPGESHPGAALSPRPAERAASCVPPCAPFCFTSILP